MLCNFPINREKDTDLVAVADLAEKGILNLVGLDDAGDRESAVFLCDAKDEVTASRVGEGADRGESVFGNWPGGLLEFDIAPLD